MDKNIFSFEYVQAEIDSLNLAPYSKGDIKLYFRTLPSFTEIEGYVDHRIEHPEDFEIPVFAIKKQTWMSLTPMEVASHYVPIQKAHGHVGVGGIGMGYFLLKIMNKPEVLKIDAFEIDKRIITYFKTMYKDRPGFEKIRFIHGDLYDNLADKYYDFFYNDIYPTLGSSEAQDEITLVYPEHAKEYHYWGLELDLYSGFSNRSVTAVIQIANDPVLADFFNKWQKHNTKYLPFDECIPSKLYWRNTYGKMDLQKIKEEREDSSIGQNENIFQEE